MLLFVGVDVKMVQWGRSRRCDQLAAAAVKGKQWTAGVGVEASACWSQGTWHDSLWTYQV